MNSADINERLYCKFTTAYYICNTYAMNANSFWAAGCNITRHDMSQSIHVGLRRFRENFGISPKICETVWNSLADQDLHPHGALPIHMLCALLFLKLYESEHINRSLAGLDEKTFRKWQWLYVDLIALKLYVVRSIQTYVYDL